MIKQSGGQRAMHLRGRVPGSFKHARGAMMKRPILATPFAFWRREGEGVLVRWVLASSMHSCRLVMAPSSPACATKNAVRLAVYAAQSMNTTVIHPAWMTRMFALWASMTWYPVMLMHASYLRQRQASVLPGQRFSKAPCATSRARMEAWRTYSGRKPQVPHRGRGARVWGSWRIQSRKPPLR